MNFFQLFIAVVFGAFLLLLSWLAVEEMCAVLAKKDVAMIVV